MDQDIQMQDELMEGVEGTDSSMEMEQEGADTQAAPKKEAAGDNVRLYVKHAFATSATELEEMFGEYGQVLSVDVKFDRETNRPRGFAFVEMANRQEAQAAIEGINGRQVGTFTMVVNEASTDFKPAGGNRFGGNRGGGNRFGGNRGGGRYNNGGGRDSFRDNRW